MIGPGGAEQFGYTFRKVGGGRFQRLSIKGASSKASRIWEDVFDDEEVQELQGLLSDVVKRMWEEFEEKIAGRASPLCFTLKDSNHWQNLSRLTHETCAEEIRKNRFREHHVYDFNAIDTDARATTHTVSPFFVYCLKSEHMLKNEIFISASSQSTPDSPTQVELPPSKPSKWGLCRHTLRADAQVMPAG